MVKFAKRLLFIILCLQATLALAEVQTAPLSAASRSFLKNEYNITNKKIILYSPDLKTDSCAHIQAFYKYLMATKQNPNIQKYFSTKSFPSPKKNAIKSIKKGGKMITRYDNFVQECGPVCIVSLKDNWIYQFPPDQVNETGALSLLHAINDLYNK